MGVREIQQAVKNLPAAERRKLTTWMVKEFPALTVDDFLAKQGSKPGAESVEPPTADNFPSDATLAHAERTAKRLGLAR